MIARCTRPNHAAFHNYGGRGITVCPRWLGDTGFPNFLSDMGERPKGKTLERRKNAGGYSPSNCRWATPAEQVLNTRVNHRVDFKGQNKTLVEWGTELGIKPDTIRCRLRDGWSVEKALTTPILTNKRRAIRPGHKARGLNSNHPLCPAVRPKMHCTV